MKGSLRGSRCHPRATRRFSHSLPAQAYHASSRYYVDAIVEVCPACLVSSSACRGCAHLDKFGDRNARESNYQADRSPLQFKRFGDKPADRVEPSYLPTGPTSWLVHRRGGVIACSSAAPQIL